MSPYSLMSIIIFLLYYCNKRNCSCEWEQLGRFITSANPKGTSASAGLLRWHFSKVVQDVCSHPSICQWFSELQHWVLKCCFFLTGWVLPPRKLKPKGIKQNLCVRTEPGSIDIRCDAKLKSSTCSVGKEGGKPLKVHTALTFGSSTSQGKLKMSHKSY